MIRLFTSYYRERSSSRDSELLECLGRNLRSDVIGEICLLLEGVDAPPIEHRKLSVRRHTTRPTYADFFRWAKQLALSPTDVAVIGNSDIYFDRSLIPLARSLQPEQCAALTRWNQTSSGQWALFDRNDSQDAWVFKGALRQISGDFPVGVPRCDNRILHELRAAGYEVVNPAFSVRSYHLHSGEREEYRQENLEHFVDPPYAYLWPHNLWSLPRTILHNVLHPKSRVSWRLDRRRLAETKPFRAARRAFSRGQA